MRYLSFALLLTIQASAQNAQPIPGTLAGFGYRNVSPVIDVAPGQVLIVSLHGAKKLLDAPVAGVPTPPNVLATSVAGFSAQLAQSRGRTPVGIFGVRQSDCLPGVPCAPITNFTIMAPFELVSAEGGLAELEFLEGDAVFAKVAIRLVPDKVHIVNACDESLIFYSILGDPDSDKESCTPAVTRPHGGGIISPRNPVRSGETLVAFAHGMGDIDPTPSGLSSTNFRGGLTKQPFIVRYAVAGGGPAFWAQAPDGASLSSPHGSYQIYFTVPPLPDNLPACGERGIYGNLIVSISGRNSTDTFPLCVSR